MASLDEEFLKDEEENRRELAYIRERLPEEVKPHFSDDDILYLMDAIVDYYFSSGILESNEDEVEINLQLVAEAVTRQAAKEQEKTFDPDEVLLIVEADLDFQEENL
jgi:hypothetical protein